MTLMTALMKHFFINAGAAQKIGELRQNPADDVWKEQVDFKVTRGQCWHGRYIVFRNM